MLEIVIHRYVPYVGDSKRALDEYTSEIFMGGKVFLMFTGILFYSYLGFVL